MDNFIEVRETLSIHCGEEGRFVVEVLTEDDKRVTMEFDSFDFVTMFDSQAINCIKEKLISYIKNR